MKLIIFASGRGSNAQAIIRATQNGRLGNVRVLSLVSDNPDAPALKIASDAGIEAAYIDPMRKGARLSQEAADNYIKYVKSKSPDLIVLAGFMRILPENFVEAFDGKIINLHPSLLPAYKGKDAIKRSFEAGEKVCGCTIHYVSAELDSGTIIMQSSVPIEKSDTLESLEERVHAAEHELIVKAIQKLS